MFLCADSGLCAVGVGGTEHAAHALPQLALVLSDADVVFFIDGLEFGVEATDDHILETITLDFRPVLDFVRRDVLGVARHIVRRIGVGAIGTDGRHELVVLVRNEILGSELRDGVDFVVLLATKFRIADEAILLIAAFDVGQQRGFSIRIDGSETLCAFKHQVFQIVGETRRLCRIVLRTCTYGDISLYARFLGVHGKIYFQSVVEGIDAGLHQVALDDFVLVVFSCC